MHVPNISVVPSVARPMTIKLDILDIVEIIPIIESCTLNKFYI